MLPILLIFLGSVMYTIAAYAHLKFNNWTFVKAFALAMPIVALEYVFSLHGNKLSNTVLGLNAIQILIITFCFYFVNLWVMNIMFLHHRVVWWREAVAFVLVCAAFLTSSNFFN